MKQPIKHVENLWIDMPNSLRFRLLDRAVRAGYLEKEFVEDIKKLYRKKFKIYHPDRKVRSENK